MRLSAAMIVRNEEACLERCLASIAKAVDEIVILDTGSTDGSAEIARSFTPHVFSAEWHDDFAEARNISLSHVTGEGVLIIDADNWVLEPEAARAELERFAAQHGGDVVGTVEILSPDGPGAEAGQSIEHAQRFFTAGRFRYEGAIHEQLVPVAGEKRVARTGVRYFHTGYMHDVSSPAHKSHRNIRILRNELEKHPDDEYYLYQLGKAHMALEEYPEACAAFEAALGAITFGQGHVPTGRLGPVSEEVLAGLTTSLAYSYVNTGAADKAVGLIEEHTALGHEGTRCADFHHALGYARLMAGDVAGAREAYERSLQLGVASEKVAGTGSFASFYHLGLLAEAEADLEQAFGFYVQALRLKGDYGPAVGRCIDLVIERQVILPMEVWTTCDRERFLEVFRERLKTCVAQDNVRGLATLLEGVRPTIPELHEKCMQMLAGFAGE